MIIGLIQQFQPMNLGQMSLDNV